MYLENVYDVHLENADKHTSYFSCFVCHCILRLVRQKCVNLRQNCLTTKQRKFIFTLMFSLVIGVLVGMLNILVLVGMHSDFLVYMVSLA